MRQVILLAVLCNLLACGVKGPPEPPLPTEASLKKQQMKEKKKQTTDGQPPQNQ